MNTKRLITASIFSLISASTALAADVLIPHQPASSTSSTIVAPTFSWTGLYLGVQAGGFSSKADLALVGQEKSFPLDKEFSPKLSGFAGGFYAGSNIDLGDSFIFGIDTDLMLSGKKHTKIINIGAAGNATVENAVGRSRRSTTVQTPSRTQGIASGQPTTGVSGESASAKSAAGTVISPAANGGTTVTKSTETRSNQTQARQVNSSQSSNASTGQPNQLARTDNSGNVNSSITVKNSGVSKPSPTPSSNTTSKLPETPSASSEQGARSEQSSSSTKTVKETPASSASSTRSETSQSAASTDTSGRSLTERTVPSHNLVLSRSKVSGSETNTSNGTSGAHGGYHSAHGGGYAYSHGASHPGGHASGANPHSSHGAHPHASRSHGAQSTQAADKNESSVYGIEQMRRMASELGLEQGDEVETLDHTFKQNWGGATRVRIGFAADRFMPYLAGGIAYGQFQDTISISVKDEEGTVVSSKNLTDETKTMIGYTLGGGVDFSVLDNVIVRAEYRYSDFGKKKFVKEKLEVNYKTNDFRVGVAYKF